MQMSELVRAARSYRRFEQTPISRELLCELVDLARVSASGANMQPLKYALSYKPETNAKVFPCTAWAGYLKDWPGPEKGERPTAYIIILSDPEIVKHAGYDPGIAAQTIVLAAAERGLGACMIGSVKRRKLIKDLKISSTYKVALVVALGVPGEDVVLDEDISNLTDIEYYRDENDVHHVPKRTLQEVIVNYDSE